MHNVTEIEAIKKLDPQNTYGTTELLVKQSETAWDEVKNLSIKKPEMEIRNVVFCGMGASIYGALVLKSLLLEHLPFPIEIIADYHIPSYVNHHSLVVLTSYSGTTEEVISCAEEAKSKNAQMLVLTKGGPLADFAKNNNVNAYIFDGKLNLSGAPRVGCGYTIFGLLALINKMGMVSIDDGQMKQAFAYVESRKEEIKKKAIQDSEVLMDKIPIVFAAEHLSGNGQILRNQFNETSKAFSAFYIVPDLNHHLMEGLQFPQESKLYFLLLNSKNYSEKIQKRMHLTQDVVKQNKRETLEFQTTGENIYQDFMETLIYGSYLTLYLGLRYDQNPAINPWVDYFKKELSK